MHEHKSLPTYLLRIVRVLLVLILQLLLLPPSVSLAENLSDERRGLLEQELFSAVWSNQPGKVAAVISEGIDPNTRVPLKNNAYRTLVYDATYKGFSGVVKVLLENGADPNAQNSNGKTALHLAAQRGMVEILTLLLNAKADPDLRSEDGSTPLINAAFDGHTDVARLLVDAGADVNIQTDRTGRTALHIASKNGHTEYVRFLLDHGARSNIEDAEHRTALGLAALNSNLPVAEILLAHGANPDAGEQPPILLAVQGGNEQLIRLILESKANINKRDADGQTALMKAVGSGYVDTARLLLKNGADPSLADSMGLTALHHSSDGKTSELLLLYETAVDPRDKEGNTPLYVAAQNSRSVQCLKCEEKVEVLVKFKANLLAVNKSGDGIIHAATAGDLHWLVEQCLRAGADINARDNMGRAPLHHAVSFQRPSIDIIRFLINGGANVNARDNSGKTPLDLATELPPVRGQEIIELLVEHGAQSSMTLEPPP